MWYDTAPVTMTSATTAPKLAVSFAPIVQFFFMSVSSVVGADSPYGRNSKLRVATALTG